MHVNDTDLEKFKSLIINGELERAKEKFPHSENTFRNSFHARSYKDLKDLPHKDFAMCLIPDDVKRANGQQLITLKATANEDCLFNAMLVLLCGNESLAMLLRLLVAGELYFNASFYADHEAFYETARESSDLSMNTLFSIALTDAGEDKFSETGNKIEAVKTEALVACTRGKWSSLMHIMGFSSVVSNPICSIYPDVNFRFRSLLNRSLNSQASPNEDQPKKEGTKHLILWSRDGNFDNRPGAWFQPNHFIPVILEDSSPHYAKQYFPFTITSSTQKPKQQGTLFSFLKPKSTAVEDTNSANVNLTKAPK